MVIREGPDDLGIQKPKNRDARFRHYLEQQLCKYSDYVWWFTDGALYYAKVRNPNLDTPGNARGFVVMPGANPHHDRACLASLWQVFKPMPLWLLGQ